MNYSLLKVPQRFVHAQLGAREVLDLRDKLAALHNTPVAVN
jgi:hypothetical protein